MLFVIVAASTSQQWLFPCDTGHWCDLVPLPVVDVMTPYAPVAVHAEVILSVVVDEGLCDFLIGLLALSSQTQGHCCSAARSRPGADLGSLQARSQLNFSSV